MSVGSLSDVHDQVPAGSATVIGHVIDVQGNQLTCALAEDEQGHAPTITVGDEDVLVGRLGSYVSIEQHDVSIIAVVTRMTEQEALAAKPLEKAPLDYRSPRELRALRPLAQQLLTDSFNVVLDAIRPQGPRCTQSAPRR